MRITWLLAATLLFACGGGSADSTGSAPSDETAGGEVLDDTGEDGVTVVIDESDDRVSSSAGEEGGVVVFWPRIMGFAGAEAALLQERLVAIARRVDPDGPIDVRPEPQRVCPRGGCEAPSLGVLLVVQDGTCATVAIIGRPHDGDLSLVRWTGDLTVRDAQVPFREPPESHITLHDRTPCADLATELAAHEAEVEAALRAAR